MTHLNLCHLLIIPLCKLWLNKREAVLTQYTKNLVSHISLLLKEKEQLILFVNAWSLTEWTFFKSWAHHWMHWKWVELRPSNIRTKWPFSFFFISLYGSLFLSSCEATLDSKITKYKSEYFIFSYSKKISFLKPFIVIIWSMV